jgi:hypothetical protein
MSKFILTAYNATDDNAVYKNYETPLRPQKGENIFTYDMTDKTYKNDNNAINIANRSIVKKVMGWAKLDKLSNMTSA